MSTKITVAAVSGVMVAFILVIVLVSLTLTRSSCDEEILQPTTSYPSSVPSVTTSSDTTTSEPQDSGVVWSLVSDLNTVEGTWEDSSLKSKAGELDAGRAWKFPYPWHLTVDIYDCGIHTPLTDNWRVAYCQGGEFPFGRRSATRAYFYLSEDKTLLHVRIADKLNTVLVRK